MTLREAAQQALEALELDAYGEPPRYERNKAMEALRAALAEPTQEELRRLHALNAELVEALRCADAMLSGANMDSKAVERKVAAALAKVEAGK